MAGSCTAAGVSMIKGNICEFLYEDSQIYQVSLTVKEIYTKNGLLHRVWSGDIDGEWIEIVEKALFFPKILTDFTKFRILPSGYKYLRLYLFKWLQEYRDMEFQTPE